MQCVNFVKISCQDTTVGCVFVPWCQYFAYCRNSCLCLLSVPPPDPRQDDLLLFTTFFSPPQSSVAIDSPSSSDATRPQNANASPWCHFGAMASGVGRHRALGHLETRPPTPLAPSTSPSPTRSRLTSASRYLDGSPLAADGLGAGLINEMYDNVISLIEWHSLMVLRDYD